MPFQNADIPDGEFAGDYGLFTGCAAHDTAALIILKLEEALRV